VPSAAFWKLAHARPADVLNFKRVTVAEAQDLRRALDRKTDQISLSDI
jgi:allophanate hydrolase subunit 2